MAQPGKVANPARGQLSPFASEEVGFDDTSALEIQKTTKETNMFRSIVVPKPIYLV